MNEESVTPEAVVPDVETVPPVLIEFTREEAYFLQEGVQAIDLKGNARELVGVLKVISSIHEKLREALEPVPDDPVPTEEAPEEEI
jgi:hypothetical protein